MSNAFFTIGHSIRPVSQFMDLLTAAGIRLVADVRSVPRSRANPQYDMSALHEALSKFDIGYEHIPALGGLRGAQKAVSPAANAFWEHQSFHNYADYAMSESFRSGLVRLRELGHARRCAIMCAEALWWRCHRRIIADYLMLAGETVFHILGPGHIEAAPMTIAAEATADGTLVYPARDAEIAAAS